MIIPDLPKVPIDMDYETRSFLESLEGKIDCINAVKVEGDNLSVLGTKSGFGYWRYEITKDKSSGKVSETHFKSIISLGTVSAIGLTLGLYILTPSMKKRRKKEEDYDNKVKQYENSNLKDIEDKIKGIRLYQGTIDEVEKDLGSPLERVDTGKPETFLKEPDIFKLMVKTYLLGGDAIVHWQPGSSVGTPVRYSSKKGEHIE